MERFIKADGEGLSQCYNCGTVCWDCMMYIDTKYKESNRLCSDCKNKYGTKEFKNVKIQWRGFKRKRR